MGEIFKPTKIKTIFQKNEKLNFKNLPDLSTFSHFCFEVFLFHSNFFKKHCQIPELKKKEFFYVNNSVEKHC
jgi:hypothetical protein